MAELLLHTARALKWIIVANERVTSTRLEKIRSWITILCSITTSLSDPFDKVFDTLLTAEYVLWDAEPLRAETLKEAASYVFKAQTLIDDLPGEDYLYWQTLIKGHKKMIDN